MSVIPLRRVIDEGERHWHDVVIKELTYEAQVIEIILDGRPCLATAIDMWRRQRDGLELAVMGKADPQRRERGGRFLAERDAAMERLCEKVRARRGGEQTCQ